MNNEVVVQINLHSEDNPILSSELEKLFVLSGNKIRDIIREARREGVPIANSAKGYFRAKSFSEIQPTIEDLRSRAFSLLQTAKALGDSFNVDIQDDLFLIAPSGKPYLGNESRPK